MDLMQSEKVEIGMPAGLMLVKSICLPATAKPVLTYIRFIRTFWIDSHKVWAAAANDIIYLSY